MRIRLWSKLAHRGRIILEAVKPCKASQKVCVCVCVCRPNEGKLLGVWMCLCVAGRDERRITTFWDCVS